MKKPKRKLAPSGRHAKPRAPQGRFRSPEEADEHVRDERMMRGRENQAALPEGASQAELAGNVRRGQVVAIHGPVAVVEPADGGALVDCTLRKSTRIPHPRATAIVVGDFVGYLAEGVPPFTVTAVEPRRSRLARVREGQEQVVCANVDLGVIIASAADPPFKPRLVDRYLIALTEGGLAAILVLNKSDRLAPGEAAVLLEPYADLPMHAVAVSASTGEGLETLREMLRGKTSVFSGQSGVGKSSLVNALIPDLEARTGEIQAHTGKGRHTTTASSLYRFPFGGAVVDTPGVRSFAVGEPSEPALRAFFPEVFEAAAGCRFGNCRHRGDLGCAMPAAIAERRVHPDRLDSYLVLVQGDGLR